MTFPMTILLSLLAFLALLLVACWLFTRSVARKVDQGFPLPEHHLTVDGETIRYRELGEGPPLVLVHGLGGQMRNFDYLPLARLAEKHRVVVIDRPGSGRSPRADHGKAAIAAQAALVAGFIREIGFARPPVLVGHSLGGAISLAVALDHPGCVRALALIAPLTHFKAVVAKPFRPLAIRSAKLRALVANTVATPIGIASSRAVLGEVFGPDPVPEDFGTRGGGLLGLRPSAFIAASTDMVAVEQDLPGLQLRYGELKLPIEILYGRGDRVLDWREQGEALANRLPQARLRVVEGGHMLPVTHPEETVACIERAAARAGTPWSAAA